MENSQINDNISVVVLVERYETIKTLYYERSKRISDLNKYESLK